MKNSTPSKQRLDQLLTSLGYASRNESKKLIASGHVTVEGKQVKKSDFKAFHHDVQFNGEPLDPLQGIVILMNKPVGLVCSHDDGEGQLVYDLLPTRWRNRDPKISTIGRLDKETSGLLLLTDDGQLLHRLTSPKYHVPKLYEVTLDRPLKGNEAEIFSAGSLMLNGEKTACLPAKLSIIDETHVTLEITEGRYHQVRRMFAAVGNHVTALHRTRIGNLTLGDLKVGEYRLLSLDELLTVSL
ncbi:MAG TPA: pseudouridine synthase [Sulfuricurvum sp.]|nr:MAG: 16S rRNA pseudouridine(516) synthase [Campylobacterales bacterium 16-40-21]OZA03903.1 MAG: 16S rRNA pseudouridine(516) synthase [Sulfuricurvum sp. 17-40-25]HQS65572.1 pseudouridine synthase [Sulfuricurvum sp.]HQT36185.1 pseudouridine synthase [Sulfuricurvum sp.]